LKILLTGASGFLGAYLFAQLQRAGHELAVVSRGARPIDFGATWVQGDLSDPSAMATQIMQFEPEAVFHLAWEGIPDFSEVQCTRNVVLSLNFLSMLGRVPSIRKIVVAGSCWEYGDRVGRCSEKLETKPSSWFTWAKDTVYHYTKRLSEDGSIDWYWPRIFYVYGKNQRPASLIPIIVRAVRAGMVPDLRSPYAKNDFIYVGDVIDGLCRFVTNEVPSGIYNFGSGHETRVLDIFSEVENLLHGENKLTLQIQRNTPPPTVAVQGFYADTEISSSLLGWKAETSIRQGLQKLLGVE
jgi:UDP-glucose 4-epimerase